MSTSAATLTKQIESILGPLSTTERSALVRSSGYAFEAWVMTMIGRRRSRRWSWVHPAGKRATFAKGNGGDLTARMRTCSYLQARTGLVRKLDCRSGHAYDGVALVQGVSVEGSSGICHDADFLLVGFAHSHGLRGDRRFLHAVIEAKNHIQAQSLGSARNLMGLDLDLNGRRHHPTAAVLVSSGPVTPQAGTLMSHWGIHHESKVTGASTAWVNRLNAILERSRPVRKL